MKMLLGKEDHEIEPYLQILHDEPGLEGDGTLLITDSLKWALQKGKISKI